MSDEHKRVPRGFFVRVGLHGPLHHHDFDGPQDAIEAYLRNGVSMQQGDRAWVWRAEPVRPELNLGNVSPAFPSESLGPVGAPRVFECHVVLSELATLRPVMDSKVVHVVHDDSPLCGFLAGTGVRSWPELPLAEGHSWCELEDAFTKGTCQPCKVAAGRFAHATKHRPAAEPPEGATRIICPGCDKVRPDSGTEYSRVLVQALWDDYEPCCNPECGGQWGTGCYHCHHPKFWTSAPDDPLRPSRQEFEDIVSHLRTTGATCAVLFAVKSTATDAKSPRQAFVLGDGRVCTFYSDDPPALYESLDLAVNDHPDTVWESTHAKLIIDDSMVDRLATDSAAVEEWEKTLASQVWPNEEAKERDKQAIFDGWAEAERSREERSRTQDPWLTPETVVRGAHEALLQVTDSGQSATPPSDGKAEKAEESAPASGVDGSPNPMWWPHAPHAPDIAQCTYHGGLDELEVLFVGGRYERFLLSKLNHTGRPVDGHLIENCYPDDIRRAVTLCLRGVGTVLFSGNEILEAVDPAFKSAREKIGPSIEGVSGTLDYVTVDDHVTGCLCNACRTLRVEEAPRRREDRINREMLRLRRMPEAAFWTLAIETFSQVWSSIDDLDVVIEGSHPADLVDNHLKRGNIRTDGSG